MLRLLRNLPRLLLLLLAAALMLGTVRALQDNKELHRSPEITETDARSLTEPLAVDASRTRLIGIWLSQFDLSPMLCQGSTQRAEKDARRRLCQAMENISSLGVNTLFVQVRPNGDSFYPSDLFPLSHYAVGSTGADSTYDPLALILEAAHAQGLSVHAWVNPLRLFSEEREKALSASYRHVAWCREDSDRAVAVNGMWYLNPAYPEARKLVADGMVEILQHYEVDGIHIDDYFYPTTDPSFDRESYDAYQTQGGTLSLGDYRRQAIHDLVRECSQAVHATREDALFGVSPSGNTQRNRQVLYADVESWCREANTLDYLCPQVYFGLEHESFDFEGVCREFAAMTKASRIPLYIGMTLGKAYAGFEGQEDPYAGSGKREWIEHRDVLARCYRLAEELGDGAVFFSYQYFFSPQDGKPIRQTEQELRALLPLLKGDEKN